MQNKKPPSICRTGGFLL